MQKKKEDIALIREGGHILSDILNELIAFLKPGVNVLMIDQKAEELIRKKGGRPAFKGYVGPGMHDPFPSTICACIDDQVVHTPAYDRELKEGQLITIDIGMQYPANNGFYTDMAKTVAIGKVSEEENHLLKETEMSLYKGIEKVKAGNKLSFVSKAIGDHLMKAKLGIVKEMVGHGVGYDIHEDPPIPNYYDPYFPDVVLKEGMVIAIEPMASLGNGKIKNATDGFSIITKDKKKAAHFEHTVLVTQDGYEILTKRT